MLKSNKAPNKFDSLTRDDLLKRLLEQEDELLRLRPKPSKFRLGQVLMYQGKHPFWALQPGATFVVLSVESRNGKWYYGYSRVGHNFQVFPEEKCRALTPTETDGTPSATEPVQEPVPTSLVQGQGAQAPQVVVQNPLTVAWDFESAGDDL